MAKDTRQELIDQLRYEAWKNTADKIRAIWKDGPE